MTVRLLATFALSSLSLAAAAQDLTWRKDIAPLVKEQCGACHGASVPSYEDWNLDRKNFEAKKIGPLPASIVVVPVMLTAPRKREPLDRFRVRAPAVLPRVAAPSISSDVPETLPARVDAPVRSMAPEAVTSPLKVEAAPVERVEVVTFPVTLAPAA